MSSSKNNSTPERRDNGIGLDFSADVARIIHIAMSDGIPTVASWAAINATQEGLVSEDELADATARWLREHRMEHLNVCTNLPQMATTESVLALPANIPEKELRSMVSLQAHTLCNISDEHFLFEYQLQDTQDEEHAVLVSLIREAAVNEHFQRFAAHNVPVTQMTSHGLAAVNALLTIHPAEASDDRMALLLNVERDYSTLSAIQNGRILFQSWLAYASDTFTLNPHDAIAALKTEISNVLQHWLDNASNAGFSSFPAKIWITGEGARDPMFHHNIAEAFPKMAVKLLCVRIRLPQQESTRTEYEARPELTIAFGLALQAMGMAPVRISIIPELAQWQRIKKLRFHWLAMAAATLTMGLAILYAALYARIQNKLEFVRRQTMELQTCLQLAPKIDQIHARHLHLQKQLLPVAEASFRTKRFIEALKNCDEALLDSKQNSKHNWGIYLADQFSFQKANSENSQEETHATKKNNPDKDYPLTTSDTFPSDIYHAPMQIQEREHDLANLTQVNELKLLKCLYIGGITPLGESRYKVVKEIQTRLQNSGAYASVDDHIDFLVKRFSYRYFAPWLDFLRENKAALDNDFTIFLLEVPFAGEYINSSLLNQKDNAASRRKARRKQQ